MIWPLLCRPTFLAPESKKNVGRHFRARTFFDVTRTGRVRPDATNLRKFGRHGDAAQPWRGEKLILIASSWLACAPCFCCAGRWTNTSKGAGFPNREAVKS